MHQVAHYVGVLRAPVEGPDWIHLRRRYEAAEGLGTLFRRFPGQIGGWRSAVVEELTAELASPHEFVRLAAVRSLERICVGAGPAIGGGARRAVAERLVPLLDDPLWAVRDRALVAIGRIDPAPIRAQLLAQLRDPRSMWRAAEALGGLRTADRDVLAALCAQLSGGVGGIAALSLARLAGVFGEDAVVAAARAGLLHPAASARSNSLRVLVLLGTPDRFELCADAMADPAVDVRVRAVAELAAAGERWHLLEAALGDHVRVRTALAASLTRFDRADPLLRRLLADDSLPVRSAARWTSITRLGSAERARAGLASADSGVRGVAARRLGGFGDRSDVDRLRALLDDPETWVRRSALLALPNLVSRLRQKTVGLRRWLAAVMIAVEQTDPDPEVRAAAKSSVAKLSISP